MPVAGTPPSSGGCIPGATGELVKDLFIRNGMSAWWYPAQLCSCWGQLLGQNAESASPDPSCPICQGRGYLYPERNTVDGVMFTQLSHMTTWQPSGVGFEGGVLLTVPYLPKLVDMYDRLGFRDIVIPLDIPFEAPFHVSRGTDLLPYTPVKVFEVNYGPTLYQEGTDFTIQGRRVVWVNNSPPFGVVYQVRMSYHPIYTVIRELARLRNYGHGSWPRSYILEETPNLSDVVIDDAVHG